VEDSGEGLSPEEKIKLFQPFRMDIDQDAGSSAGLGLFSLARRVDALHGRYGVRSRSDGQQGNCFWFSFPYIPDHCSPVAAPPLCGLPSDNSSATSLLTEEGERTMVMEGSGKKRMLRVLLVDDSASVLKMTRMMLQRLGCTVDIAYDGSESLQKTLQQWDNGTPYDVVLTDIQMPVKNGYEYCRELRGVEQRYSEESSAPRHQLVIGASANSDDVTAASAIRAGIDAFLGKPYSSKLFLDLVQRRLSKMTDDDGGNDDGDDT
jgi:CheY-like chemotaxis protein